MLLTGVQVKSFKADLVKGEVTLAFAVALSQDVIGERFKLTQWQEDEVDLTLEVHPEGGEQLPLFAEKLVSVGNTADLAQMDWQPAVVHDDDAPVVEVPPAPDGETLDEFIDGLDIAGAPEDDQDADAAI